MNPGLRFVPKPAPAPPRIVGGSGPKLFRPPSPFQIGGPKIPPGSAGGSLPLPPLPPVPWQWIASVGFGALGWFALLELLFTRPVADGTRWDELLFDPSIPDSNWFPQPVPERDPVQGDPEPVDGTWYYSGVQHIWVDGLQIVSDAVGCFNSDSAQGWTQGGNPYRISYPDVQGGSFIEITTNTLVQFDACGEGGDTGGFEVAYRVTHFDNEGNQISEPLDGRLWYNGTKYGNYLSRTTTSLNWIDAVTYFEEKDGDLFPPGPIIPQPSPYPEQVVPAPRPDFAPQMLSARQVNTVPAPEPIPFLVPQPSRRVEPLPQPETEPLPQPVTTPAPPTTTVAPAVKPDLLTDTIIDGAVAPAVAPKPPVTPPDLHFPNGPKDPVGPGGSSGDLAKIGREVGRIEQKTARGLGNGLQGLQLLDDIWNLLNSMGGGGTTPAQTLKMLAACDYVAENQLAEYSVSYPEQDKLDAILSRVNDIPGFLQQHLAWKTPTCGNDKVPMEGDWVSIRFVSDAPSPNSNRPLRKLFRYRSKSSASLEQLREHWAGFTWQAGPVCVGHLDAWWGNPQCWAVSVDEGKRVIRHAGGEAGIDPDQTGRWQIGGSRSPRYGMPGTMRIEQFQGIDWITSREGPDAFPQL